MIMAFVNQAKPDIRHKLQKTEELADKTIQELLAVAQNTVYNIQETSEDRQMRVIASDNAKQTQNMVMKISIS